MQTPISFALEILLDCTTIEQAHKKTRKYIKDLERAGTPTKAPPVNLPVHMQQAPSTQRLLEQQTVAPMAAPPPPITPARIVGGEVNNGDGTKGKRKW